MMTKLMTTKIERKITKKKRCVETLTMSKKKLKRKELEKREGKNGS